MAEALLNYFNGIQEILQQFSEDEVISLASTITRGLLKNKINTRQDALNAIINHSEDVESILRRKLFTREKLLSYLYDKKISIKFPITKPEMIKVIKNLWRDDSQIFKEETNCQTRDDYLDDSQSYYTVSSNDLSETNVQGVPQNVVGDSLVEQDASQELQVVIIELGEQFSQWFYKLLNENQLTADHFFPDASLTLTLISNDNTSSKTILNNQAAVTECLLCTKNQYDLYFNPNLLKENIKAKMDPHGLVMLIVSGTLHSNSICVGVFDQMFALARDPFAENNWKIKRTDLSLNSGGNSGPPRQLCDTESSNNTAIT